MAKEILETNEESVEEIPNSFDKPKEWSLHDKLFSKVNILWLFHQKPELNDEQKRVLQWQIERFVKLMWVEPVMESNELSLLPKWTLIHQTDFNKEEDFEKLKNIASTWIITWQAFWVPEADQETYYCADFLRVRKDCKIKERRLKRRFSKSKLLMPMMGVWFDVKDAISFIITPNEKMRELSSYDCYNDDENWKFVKTFVNEKWLPLKYGDSSPCFFGLLSDFQNWWDLQTNIWSSILFWVPSNFITWIVCWEDVVKDKEKILFLKDTFPGRVLYDKEWNVINI